ncbi:nucleoporin GLE1-like [Dendronephthya gigantea]|uniref:nucleoporin GLE1-like n=1 Tax=Dendronephthya gigantea TaxID=151771 RepID=UPI00106C563D|nr:nucleoporin GLE1-like [Dendronephthya gigantea]
MYGVKLDEILTRTLAEENFLAIEREERRAVVENLKTKISSLYQHVLKNVEVIEQKFTDSKNMSFVDAQVYEEISSMLNEIVTKGRRAVVDSEAVDDPSNAKTYSEFMNKLIQVTFSIDAKVTTILEEAHEKAVNELKKRELEEEEKIKLEAIKHEQQEQKRFQEQKARERDIIPSEKEISADHKNKLSTESTKDISKGNEVSSQKLLQFISTNTLEEYTTLQEHLSTVQASYKEFISDSTQTKYKFDLQKAVNTPINALSAHSPSQLNDKILRLVKLLSGGNVEVGGKRVNCKNHPSAMIYCKDLVAKKLVMQGAQQVSSNPQSAFLYAAVMVGIWSAFPDVGQLILAHFHRSYPYLVPYYMPQVEGQSNNDFHKALGYSVNNDKIEDEDHFLKKFSGTVQLYAAVVTSKGATTSDHPHGIDKGWTWLARTLNLKPYPSITATMLYEFIKVAGHLLMKQYGKQFQKLLLMLFKDFIPAMDEVTPAKKKAPVQRFKDFLDECVKTQKIAVPKGYLTERWWQSGHF